MSRTVYRSAADKSAAGTYHLFDDCSQFKREPLEKELDQLFHDAEACQICIRRAFARKEACSKCDAQHHKLELDTLERPMVEWSCPADGFTDVVGGSMLREKLSSAGVSIDRLREAVESHRTANRGSHTADILDELNPDDLRADGGQVTTVYLAGPVAAEPDGGAEWRSDLQDYYGDRYDFRDPLAKYNLKVENIDVVDGHSNPDNPETVGIAEVVEDDLQMIDESDGVLVGYNSVRSTGTPMEVMYARERDMPVAIWVRDETEFDDLPIWYQYHATAITTDPEMGLRHIERQSQEAITDGGRRGLDRMEELQADRRNIERMKHEAHGGQHPRDTAQRWISQAEGNVERWGLQDQETLLLAMQEELGELTRAFLMAEHEGVEESRVGEELDDLAALLFQLCWTLEEGSDD